MASSPLDHLVYGVPDVLAGVRQFGRLTGVEPAPGGRHPERGTANYLIGLDETSYLEIIGPDPDAEQPPGWFGLAQLREARLLTWAVRPADVDGTITAARAAGYDPGAAEPMSRRAEAGDVLRWRLTPDTVERTGGTMPFLIDWGTARHPASHPLPRVGLLGFTVSSSTARRTRTQLAALGAEAHVEHASAPGLRCVLDTPNGPVTLR